MSNTEDPSHEQEISPNDYHAEIDKWFTLFINKHPEIYQHSVRVSMLAEKIAVPLELSVSETAQLIRGCFVHDIGKIMIPRDVILNRGPLDDNQWDLIKLHPILGAELLESYPGFAPQITAVVRSHHERWDGQGYPEGLQGEEIHLFARICAVIDAFDSMTSNFTYRRRLNISEAKLELLRHAGTQFDPDIVHALMRLSNDTLDIYSLT
ncbi:putative nucleotidyltransferase with HDIG domain [Fontibacillus solani]|uniref:Putative nucleotidyltransferase with HDIG domain n=1 Tax=Fontibacillus solani TaxID=1572857 RepID=A0A7W3SPB3_9BACL|nr:HD domain-containing phosphohydrolase [Fontibacillus solani]MBA9083609.1 putative nucleotidyltransferase with HDIG domain [Fontibacillus solani]